MLFGLRFYNANASQFIIYIVLHLFGAVLVSDMIYGTVRWSFISELYETIQALHLAPAIIRVLIGPSALFMHAGVGYQWQKEMAAPAIPLPGLQAQLNTALGPDALTFGDYAASRSQGPGEKFELAGAYWLGNKGRRLVASPHESRRNHHGNS